VEDGSVAEHFGDNEREAFDHGETPIPLLSLRGEGAEAPGVGGLAVHDGHQGSISEELHHAHKEHQSCLARHVKLIEHCEASRLLGEENPGSALFKYCKYTHVCTKGVLFITSMYKMYVQETYCY